MLWRSILSAAYVLLIAGLGILAGGAHRVNAEPFGVTPHWIELRAAAGDRVTGQFYVRNYSGRPITVEVTPVDFTFTDQGVATPPAGSLPGSLYPYLTLMGRTHQVPPDKRIPVTFHVDVPPDMTGSRWMAFHVEQVVDPSELPRSTMEVPSPTSGDTTRVHFLYRVRYRVAVLLTVEGGAGPDGRITALRTSHPPAGGEVFGLDIDLANTGDVYFRPTGWVEVWNEQGERVLVLPVPTQLFLPGQTSTLSVTAEPRPPLPPGRYMALAVINFGGDELAAGQLVFRVEP